MAACVLGEHEGLPPADARTSAALVCEALREAGAHVTTQPIGEAEASAHASAYRIDMRPLGRLIVIQVGYESPVGTRLESRSLQLNGIEEVPTASLRIADALVHHKPIDDTAKVDTLVGQDTRRYEKKSGETLFGFGIFGMAIPDKSWAGYGAYARLYYEALRYAVGADFRLGGSGEGDGDASLVAISVGARYFLSESDVSLFAGGGLGILWLDLSERYDLEQPDPGYAYDYVNLEGSGLAAYGEFGVEFLRMHDSRLDVALRADAPIFTLEDGGREFYALPVTLTVSYSID